MMKPVVSHNRRHIELAWLAGFSALAMSFPAVARAADCCSYVLFSSGSDSVSTSAPMEDLRRARALRVGSEGLLYFHRDGADYVVRDPATLRAVRALFEPRDALEAHQAALGFRQDELGRRQERLDAHRAEFGSRETGAPPREIAELAREEKELAQQQGKLGQEQAALGEQQKALGGEEHRLSRIVEEKLDALLADAVRRGVAEPVR